MKKFDFIVLMILFISVIVTLVVIMNMNKEGVKCVTSPLIYGVTELETKYNATTFCTCSIGNKFKPFIVTSQKLIPFD